MDVDVDRLSEEGELPHTPESNKIRSEDDNTNDSLDIKPPQRVAPIHKHAYNTRSKDKYLNNRSSSSTSSSSRHHRHRDRDRVYATSNHEYGHSRCDTDKQSRYRGHSMEERYKEVNERSRRSDPRKRKRDNSGCKRKERSTDDRAYRDLDVTAQKTKSGRDHKSSSSQNYSHNERHYENQDTSLESRPCKKYKQSDERSNDRNSKREKVKRNTRYAKKIEQQIQKQRTINKKSSKANQQEQDYTNLEHLKKVKTLKIQHHQQENLNSSSHSSKSHSSSKEEEYYKESNKSSGSSKSTKSYGSSKSTKSSGSSKSTKSNASDSYRKFEMVIRINSSDLSESTVSAHSTGSRSSLSCGEGGYTPPLILSPDAFATYRESKSGENSFEETETGSENGEEFCLEDIAEHHLPPYFPAIQGCRSVTEYKYLNRIAEGTYGVVYRYQDKRTKEIVVLKRLKMEKEKDGFPITSLREINTLFKAQHPNIVTAREIVVGTNMDQIYIVMDYVEHDLKSLIDVMNERNHVFLPGEIKCLMSQLLSAVAHIHDNWILHRDLKTSNILVSHKGILKVADFGLAREYGSPLKKYTTTVVTLWYRAPELLLGAKDYSTPIDMWSVGCILGEMLRMEALFPGRSETDQINRIFRELGTPCDRVWPGYSELPMVKKINFSRYLMNNLVQRFHASLSQAGLDLLNKLLTYNPDERISAEAALKHPYFKESPLAIDPAMFPTYPAMSEGGTHKVTKTPEAPRGGDDFREEGRREENTSGFHMGQREACRIKVPKGAGFHLKF